MTSFSQHKSNWSSCTRCPLHKSRRKVVLCRGVLPAEVLFIGEAPGESEDVLGVPFIGPAGKLLDRLIKKAEEQARITCTKCWTNLVACFPNAKKLEGRKKVEPLPGEIASCYPRLDEFIDLCNPQLIVAVGELSKKQSEQQHWERRASVISITHPAAILRMGVEQQGLAIQRVVVNLSDSMAELIPF